MLDAGPILLAHAAVTWALVGLIWMVQLVHYPLFAEVGADRFARYEKEHQRRISWIVVPAMLLELVLAGILLLTRPAGVSAAEAGLGVALLAIIWGSTFALQMPDHGKLALAFDPAVHARLVRTNAIRTAAWSLRGLVAGAMLLG